MDKQNTGVYTTETKIRYSECGASRQLRLYSILDYLQDTCTFQVEELGVGLSYMQEHQTAWVLNSWQAQIDRYPVFGETIRIATWPYDFHALFGYRNFQVTDAEDHVIVRAASVWVFMNIKTGRPARIAPEVAAAYQTEPRLAMDYKDRKIQDFEAALTKEQPEPFRIPRHFIDTNHHMNNAKYVLLAEELLPQEIQPVRIRAEYKKPAVYGDILYPSVRKRPDGWSVRLGGTDGKPYALLEFDES